MFFILFMRKISSQQTQLRITRENHVSKVGFIEL